jgi:hypothetical protein
MIFGLVYLVIGVLFGMANLNELGAKTIQTRFGYSLLMTCAIIVFWMPLMIWEALKKL